MDVITNSIQHAAGDRPFWSGSKVTRRIEVQKYLEPTQESGRAFFMRGTAGKVVMLNLLRFRAVADYSTSPELGPDQPITGEAAYRLYMSHTMPHLEKSGGKLLFYGRGGPFLIGPNDERWDAAMLVEQSSPAAFMAFASNADYLSGIGHRTAALEDSRLLPLQEVDWRAEG
jgi:uncharacterized protein (DUF1330 family)